MLLLTLANDVIHLTVSYLVDRVIDPVKKLGCNEESFHSRGILNSQSH